MLAISLALLPERNEARSLSLGDWEQLLSSGRENRICTIDLRHILRFGENRNLSS